jgi:hypothetical protein
MVSTHTRNDWENTMLTITRNISIGLAVVAIALVPSGAFAKDGADDTGFDDNGGLRDDSVSDDTQADDSRGGDGNRQEKRVAGTCTGNATSKLKAKLDGGRIETEFEVDQNRNGVTWKVRFRLNGERVVKTRATTHAPSGSFSVERRLDNPAGSDHVVARAISPSGQVCKASLTI